MRKGRQKKKKKKTERKKERKEARKEGRKEGRKKERKKEKEIACSIIGFNNDQKKKTSGEADEDKNISYTITTTK